MRIRPRGACARRGGALVLAVFAVVVVSGLTVAFLQLGLSFNREQVARNQDESAIFVAEAGLAESVFALRAGRTGRVGTSDVPARLGNAVLWVEAADVGNDLKALRSSGMAGGGRAALEAFVFQYADPRFGAAIFSSRNLRLPSNVFVDSFDSDDGSYAAQLAAAGGAFVDEGAVVVSNGDVQIDSAVELHGDVHPGPGSSLVAHSSSNIDGVTEPTGEVRELPPVTVPTIASSGSYAVPSGTFATLPGGDYSFSSLSVSNTAGLTIAGPTRLVIADWTLQSNSLLTFDPTGGPITLYVTGDVDIASNSGMVTTTAAAVDVALNFVGGPGQYVSLDSNSEFYGRIYSPEGTVEISSNFEVFGSLVADGVVLNSNVSVHYDEALQALATEPDTVRVATWREVEFPVSQYRVDRRDPFAVLGVAPGDLPSPEDAHDPAP